MRKLSSSLIGGLAGAIALNILHQVVKEFDHEAPHLDLIGEEALSKGMEKIGINPPSGDILFTATLAADLFSNGAYFSLAGFAKRKHVILFGTVAGFAAGIGALKLTKPMGLRDAPVTRTTETKALTILWYTFGGFVAGSMMYALRKK